MWGIGPGIGFAKSGGGEVAPTVNFTSESKTSASVAEWELSYTGTVTAYNLVAGECSIRTTETLTGTVSVNDGTTATPTVVYTQSGGQGAAYLTVLAGACQNGGTDNEESAESTTLLYFSGK